MSNPRLTSHIDDLKGMLKCGPAVLLIRHAARGDFSDPRTGNDVPITDAGRAAATQLGLEIAQILAPADRVLLAHSPVHRCVQTAAAIHAGLSSGPCSSTLIGAREHLGGPYLVDPKPALDLAAQLGAWFLRHWFDGTVPESLVQPARDAANEQVVRALELLDQPEGPRLAILVSHDWNLMLVREHYVGVRHEDAGWIDFLDGVAMQRTEDGVAVGYRLQTIRSPLKTCR
jgi:broad specificity phosphatase PhoE